MLAKLNSGTVVGIIAEPVTVEVDVARVGLPNFTIVGMADRSVEESRERVRSAIRNSGADFPSAKITVNLAPADLPKEGAVFDLSIAVGILIGSGQIISDLADTLLIGELSLDGSLSYTQGVLPLVLMARKKGLKRVFLPKANAIEAGVVEGIEVFALESLRQVSQFLTGQILVLAEEKIDIDLENTPVYEFDFSSVRGQENAKRALEIAASGGHNLLMKGPPGSGKTMLARSFPSILPPLTLDEALEISQIYSISGNLSVNNPLMTTRPFRSPHHSASYVGLIGGGNNVHPGEVSMAHRGVLFLDELPEFPRQALEALRQPLEDRQVTISRSSGTINFPAQFILLAAQNPCPCGYLGSKTKACICTSTQIARYQKRISGPLLDRIDLHLEVGEVEVEKLTTEQKSEDSKSIRERVAKARKIQTERFRNLGIYTNSEMSNAMIKQFCRITPEAKELLHSALIKMNISARAFHRVLKVARTIADLVESEKIQTEHIAEALNYRVREH